MGTRGRERATRGKALVALERIYGRVFSSDGVRRRGFCAKFAIEENQTSVECVNYYIRARREFDYRANVFTLL